MIRTKKDARCRIVFDMATMFLGPMCRHGHEYVATNKTLRYKKSRRKCVECHAACARRIYRKTKEILIAKNRVWHKENPDRSRQYRLRYFQKEKALILARRVSLYQSNADIRAKRNAESARYYEANKAEALARMAWRYKNEPDFRARILAAGKARRLRRKEKQNHIADANKMVS